MKKLAVFLSIVCSLLIVSLTLFSKTVQAETSKKVDVITEIKIQNSKGEELATGLGRYDTFRLNAKFALEGKNVKEGDTTEVTIDGPIDSDFSCIPFFNVHSSFTLVLTKINSQMMVKFLLRFLLTVM